MQKNTRAKFTSPDGKIEMLIQMTVGKKGVNVRATLKEEGRKAVTGGRAAGQSEADAQKAFDALVKKAQERGWAKKESGASALSFNDIPTVKDAKVLLAGAPAAKAAAKK